MITLKYRKPKKLTVIRLSLVAIINKIKIRVLGLDTAARIERSKILDVVVSGINYSDYPKFVDAFIESATWGDTYELMSETEIEILENNFPELYYDLIQQELY